MGRRVASLPLLALLAACTPTLNAPLLRSEPDLSQDIAAPELALLHYRLVREVRDGRIEDAVVCVGIGQGEAARPLDEARERGLMVTLPWVAPFDRCQLQADKSRRDAITGDKAVLVDVHDLACTAPGDCTAWAGTREFGWTHYRLRFQRGAWQISGVPSNIVPT